MKEIYLDNNATTPVDPAVVKAMEPYWQDKFANPGSVHKKGVEANRAVKRARRTMADLLGVNEREVFFTSGATEADNWALKGTLLRGSQKWHVITSQVEHDAVLKPLRTLEMEAGHEVTRLAPDKHGRITQQQVLEAMQENTRLVAIMHVNNELGTRYSINDIAAAVKARNPNTLVFSDGVQAFGKMPIDLTNIDLYSLSGHKIHGPKGVGVLVVREGTALAPLLEGGGQESGMRSGTLNVPGIVGLAKAAEIACKDRETHWQRAEKLNKLLRDGISNISDAHINSPDQAVPYTVNATFPPVPSEVLLHALERRGIYVSAGSACVGSKGVSHVLRALPVDQEIQESTIRFSMSKLTTEEDIKKTIHVLQEEVAKLRQIV